MSSTGTISCREKPDSTRFSLLPGPVLPSKVRFLMNKRMSEYDRQLGLAGALDLREQVEEPLRKARNVFPPGERDRVLRFQSVGNGNGLSCFVRKIDRHDPVLLSFR